MPDDDNLTIEIDDELMAQLVREATEAGLSLEEYARQKLARSLPEEPRDKASRLST
jgi:predicted HicB family RNase H-like nuclease